ncbi:MAG: hypothetical protein HXY40_17740 [Chloroflexi bacterium]|nr:hypothetical protein [Chloroflexota bacterium]
MPGTAFLRRALTLCGVLVLLAGCAGGTPSDAPLSIWGPIVTLAAAAQGDGPALAALTPGLLSAAWIGADADGIQPMMRQHSEAGLGAPVTLRLSPVRPYGQRLLPAGGGNLHLLWLDADAQTQSDPFAANETRLFAALITPTLTLERGPTLVSSGQTWHYAAAAAGDGSLWLAWSGGLAAEPTLYWQRLDAAGRPLFPQRLALNADWPLLTRTDAGQIDVYWAQEGRLWRARLNETGAQQPLALTTLPLLNAGDRLASITAGLDRTHAYVFWNIRRADGTAETWFAAGAFGAQAWDAARRLGFALTAGSFETGFNGGAAAAADAGETWLAWASALVGQYAALPVAVWDGAFVGLVYFSGGRVAGYQRVAAVPLMIGAPQVATDRERHVYLAWAEAGAEAALLRLTSTR